MINRPEDIQAEHALIKSIFLNPDLLPSVRDKVTTKIFASECNRMVFDALKKMQDDGNTPDQVALRGYLNSNYERIGGDDYLAILNAIEALPSNIDQYIWSIKDTFLRRSTIDAGLEIADLAMHASSADMVVGKLVEFSDRLISELTSSSGVTELANLAESQFGDFQSKVKDPGFKGIRTGIDGYDMLIGGLGRGDEVLIAGRPGVGKTSLLISILYYQAAYGIPVLLFSYEMSPEQIFNRVLSIASGVSHTKIRTGRVSSDEKSKIEIAFKHVASLPFYMTYSTSMGIDEVANTATKMCRSHGIEVAALDYLQLMSTKMDNQNNELGRISRVIKLNAQRNQIAWLAASQLSRRVEYREDKRPILSDLRDSGNLEQDADIVIMLYREHMYNPIPNNENLAEMLVRKNRHGQLASVLVNFEHETMRFSHNGR